MNLNRVNQATDRITLKNALISVADKEGLDHLVPELWKRVPELRIYSTGGTYALLLDMAEQFPGGSRKEQVISISDYTRQPEMQGGLVKTLDYRIYLGLLSEEYNQDHQNDLTRSGAVAFDLTVCNFYPFETTAARTGVTLEDLRTHIDIGGPTMVRASAKNFLRVTTLCTPQQYPELLAELDRETGRTTLAFRLACAQQAFRYTGRYETSIAEALTHGADAADLRSLYLKENSQ